MTGPTDRTRRPFVMAEAVPILERTPATLNALLRGLPDGWTTAHEGGETWSPYDVVGHLIHGDQTVWIPRARTILEAGESRPFDTLDRFAQFAVPDRPPLENLLDDFAAARRASLDALASLRLTAVELDRRGRHPLFGVVTMRQLLATWVAHDLDHIFQISRVMAGQYTDEIGPWRDYLRIISGEPG